MKDKQLKLGQKVVITELMSFDAGKLQVGDVGTIVDNTRTSLRADFPTRGLTAYWVTCKQIRKCNKEPKHLELKVGDEVKIRNYKKYPELRVTPERSYIKAMTKFIGTVHTVTCVFDTGVMLDNGYSYCTPTLKRVKEPKTTEITVGSKVRVMELIGSDADYGIAIGEIYTVVHVHPSGNVRINLPNLPYGRSMCKHQLELVS